MGNTLSSLTSHFPRRRYVTKKKERMRNTLSSFTNHFPRRRYVTVRTESRKKEKPPAQATLAFVDNPSNIGREKNVMVLCVKCKQNMFLYSIRNGAVQTHSKTTTTAAAQTAVTFVEKLTHNNTQEVGSSEVFDVKCEVCDVGSEKGAVGFCRTCRQYMCLQCCRIHETFSSTKKHTMVGKADFVKVMKQKTLFNQKLVPVHQSSLKYDGKECKIGAFNIPNCEDIHFWTPFQEGTCTLTTIDQQSGNPLSKTVGLSDQTNDDLCEKSDPKCTKHAYFVMSEDVYLDKVSSNCQSVVYKYCPEHSDATVKIAFKFSGNCHCVVPFNNNLALSAYIQTGFSTPDWHVRIVDHKGLIINQICYDGKGEPLFKEPRHLASSHTGDILFVSDYGLKSVIAVDKHGQTLFKFSLHELSDHWEKLLGITCDEENNVYVACKNKVIQISSNGLKCRTILQYEKNNGRKHEILDVCYNLSSKQLAVADFDGPTATIFKFSP